MNDIDVILNALYFYATEEYVPIEERRRAKRVMRRIDLKIIKVIKK